MQELTVLLCLVFLMISIGHGQITDSNRLNSFGYIDYPSPTADLLLQSSFESVTLDLTYPSEPYIIGLLDVNGTSRSNLGAVQRTGSETWLEDGTNVIPHTGARCLGLRSGPTGIGARVEWELTHLDGSIGTPNSARGLSITDDFYVSVWLYFPDDWSLAIPESSHTWYELLNLFWLGVSGPRTCLHIHRYSNGHYDMVLHYEEYNGAPKINWVVFDPLDISSIIGKWTKFAWYIHRSTVPTECVIKFWIDDVPKVNGTSNREDFRTKGTGSTNWWFTFAKSYLDGDGNYHYLYVDDLQVWDGIP